MRQNNNLRQETVKDALERFAQLQKEHLCACPRCGRCTMKERTVTNALSRHANIYICDKCGTDEAMRDFVGCVLPIEEWAISINPENYIR